MKSKITRRQMLRKIKGHLPGYLGIALLITVGVAFFITLFTIAFRYEQAAESYLQDFRYPDVTVYGKFTQEDVSKIRALNGIDMAKGRHVKDYRDGEIIYRVISFTEEMNLPWYYGGTVPQNTGECLILQRNAAALGLQQKDTLQVNGRTLQITGVIASPEYIYMVQSKRAAMAPPDRFVVLYVKEEFFSGPYTEILALGKELPDHKTIAKTVSSTNVAYQKDQLNYIQYQDDLEQIRSFAYIFPAVFAVLIAVVIYVMLARTMARERRLIGTSKALGASNQRILWTYAAGYGAVAVLACLLGGVAAMLLCNTIIGILQAMFEVPALQFTFYPWLWIGPMVVSVMICLISSGISMRKTLTLLPAQAMGPRVPKGGKRILLERAGGLWQRLSWGTRYAIKSTLRNKGRFLAVVIGMCASCSLILFSLGFHNSILHTQDQFFEKFANYDAIVEMDPLPLEIEHPAASYGHTAAKTLVLPVTAKEREVSVTVIETGFDMLRLPMESARTGIVLPQYYADIWGLRKGDSLDIVISEEGEKVYSVVISDLVEQNMGLSLYTSWEYLRTVAEDLPEVYNVLFLRTDNLESLKVKLQEEDFNFSTIEDDKIGMGSVMESITVLIFFMIACAVVLGVAVLYSVGQINFAARSHEYLFMGVMGYGRGRILAAHIKETVLQLILAIPLGYVLGHLLLELIKWEFSEDTFVVAVAVYPGSYILAALLTILITGMMLPLLLRQIDKMDIVEGLKEQGE